MPPDSKQTSFLDLIARYWFLIFFIGGMAVTWGSFSTRMNTQEAKILVLEQEADRADNSLQTLSVSLGRIETSLQFIKEKIDESSR